MCCERCVAAIYRRRQVYDQGLRPPTHSQLTWLLCPPRRVLFNLCVTSWMDATQGVTVYTLCPKKNM